MSAAPNDLAGAASPAPAEEPGRGSRRTAPRPGAVTAEQMKVIEAKSNLSMAEACLVSGRVNETLRKAIRSGALPAFKWGRRVVIRRADLDAFMNDLPSARGAA